MAFVEEGGSGPNILLGKDLAGSGLIIEEEHLKIWKLPTIVSALLVIMPTNYSVYEYMRCDANKIKKQMGANIKYRSINFGNIVLNFVVFDILVIVFLIF